ncbi:MAG: sigma-70 family RNA polymerase sigma factor [Myxococcales bacterium]|nr:sigma-70 family RNA polymerase sigma factor [Myxococcales bacterium]
MLRLPWLATAPAAADAAVSAPADDDDEAAPGAAVAGPDAAPAGSAGADADAALVARARRGHRDAFDLLVRRHQRGLWRLVRRYVRDDADAADVTQQAFVRALGALERFRGEASVRTWLYRIGINAALNHLRDRARELPTDDAGAELAAEAVAPVALLDAERRHALRAAVAELPPRQRLVLELRVFDDLSFREVAALADCTENAAKVSFHYAVKRLREVLGAGGDGADRASSEEEPT